MKSYGRLLTITMTNFRLKKLVSNTATSNASGIENYRPYSKGIAFHVDIIKMVSSTTFSLVSVTRADDVIIATVPKRYL